MKFLVIALGIAVGLAAVWRIRAGRQARLDLEWESEVASAIDEGRDAGT